MKTNQILFSLVLLFAPLSMLSGEEIKQPVQIQEGHNINFKDVSIVEFIRFVSRIARVSFIYDEDKLNFKISVSSGTEASPDKILGLLIKILRQNGYDAQFEDGSYIIEKASEKENDSKGEKIAPVNLKLLESLPPQIDKSNFHVYKVQYNKGIEILTAVKQIGNELKMGGSGDPTLIRAIGSMQWVESTNSLLFSGDKDAVMRLVSLIKSIDQPLKQVFIEVLVIETDVKNGLDFGLEWGGGGKYKDQFGFGGGNFPNNRAPSPFAKTLKGINAENTPTGPDQIPLGRGFDLGVIGDIILHKGKTFITLGSLVSALQVDGDSTIILNQKIIAQDTKQSTIFVGDNIPFVGSTVETVGPSQQTTANIEYRDIGVSLNITPYLGEDDIITLEIAEDITEATNNLINTASTVNGIQTTKTNMITRVHVPDQRFLVLSGMIRNTKTQQKTGIPCLGGLPLVGAAFSKNKTEDEKRNVIIFVRPQIVNSAKEYAEITHKQEDLFRKQSGDPAEFNRGLDQVEDEPYELP